MTATIAYDLPVKNLIDALSATGHVTHTKHRKSKVTLHHNGGRLSHEGVLQVWQTRPASAHFDLDALGDCAQYVDIVEYAWATGSTEGNVASISIEMANLTVGPEWAVPEITWRRAARLTGWIHARVFGWRPTRDSVVVHHYWSSTSCAGPYIDGVYNQILAIAQASYDAFAIGNTPEGDDDMLDAERDYVPLLRMLQRAFTFDLRPKGTGSPGQTWEAGSTIFELLTGIQSGIAAVKAVADIDEAKLAEELDRRGVDLGGASIVVVKEAFSEVLSNAFHAAAESAEQTG